mmetsp:Transcript_114166/g.179731  ORF Transcript_114166/g.179731 Transcript_114166/m.179731 type:complete len:171 (+) Transcript_114166:69-581(+)
MRMDVVVLFCLVHAGQALRGKLNTPLEVPSGESSKLQAFASLLFGGPMQLGANMHQVHSRSSPQQMQVVAEAMKEELAVLGVQPGEEVDGELVAMLEVLSKLGVDKNALSTLVEEEEQKPKEDEDEDEAWSAELFRERLSEIPELFDGASETSTDSSDMADVFSELLFIE